MGRFHQCSVLVEVRRSLVLTFFTLMPAKVEAGFEVSNSLAISCLRGSCWHFPTGPPKNCPSCLGQPRFTVKLAVKNR